MILLDTGLGFDRSDKAIVIQVFTSTRKTINKTKFYKLPSKHLKESYSLAPKDLLASVMTNTDVG